jgi:hypothetical protein
MVGLTGLEPVTLRLSSACSNQLSYRPENFAVECRHHLRDCNRLYVPSRPMCDPFCVSARQSTTQKSHHRCRSAHRPRPHRATGRTPDGIHRTPQPALPQARDRHTRSPSSVRHLLRELLRATRASPESHTQSGARPFGRRTGPARSLPRKWPAATSARKAR